MRECVCKGGRGAVGCGDVIACVCVCVEGEGGGVV